MVDSADATAAALERLLIEKQLLQVSKTTRGVTHYLVTDSVSRFQHVGEIFLGETLSAGDIELVDA